MNLVTIGGIVSAIGLLSVVMPSLDHRKRLAAALIGALGVLLLVLSRPSTSRYRKQTRDIRAMCRSVAMAMDAFESSRTSSSRPWTKEETIPRWSGMYGMLILASYVCIPDVSSCDRLMVTNPYRAQFTAEFHSLTVAFRTGEPCTP